MGWQKEVAAWLGLGSGSGLGLGFAMLPKAGGGQVAAWLGLWGS